MRIKKVSLIIATVLTLSTLTGCSKEKEVVFESNVAVNNSSDKKITQEEVKIDLPEKTKFDALYYDNDKIIGNLKFNGQITIGTPYPKEFPIGGMFKENLYELSKENEISDTGISDLGNYFYCRKIGLSNNTFDNSKEVYLYNREIGEKKEVGKYSSYVSTIVNEKFFFDGEYYTQDLVDGNDDYGYILSNYKKGNINRVNFQFLDLINNKTYVYDKQGKDEPLINAVLYSKDKDSFYCIKDNGVVYELTIDGKEVGFKEKVKLNTQSFNMNFGSMGAQTTAAVKLSENGEIIIYRCFRDSENKNDNRLMIIYNPTTNKVTEIYQDEKDNISEVRYVRNSDLVVVKKCWEKDIQGNEINQQYYIGKVNNGKIDIYYKIDIQLDYGDRLQFNNAIANDNGSEIFLDMTKTDAYIKENSSDVDVSDLYIKLKIQ